LIAARRGWLANRAALIARAALPGARVSPSKLAHETEPREPVSDSRERALEFGVMVHEALERMEATGLTADAHAMVERALKLKLLARVAKADEVYRELPFATKTMDGKIDLLFREGKKWTIVDYKTDVRPDAERYRQQLRAYADALKEVAGIEVSELALLFVATGEQVNV
jgi:ATP-dependent exoDNAse (exonuclease V) beta subunit